MNTQFDNFKKRIILTPITAILYYLLSSLTDDSYFHLMVSGQLPTDEFILFFIIGLILSFVFIELSVCYSRFIFNLFQRIESVYKKMVSCYILLFFVNNVTAYFISSLIGYLDYEEIPYFYQNLYLFGVLITFVSGIYITSIYIDAYTTSENRKKELEIKLLEEKQIATNTKLNTLRQQIDPHFMFNNFSILAELIIESPSTAEQFLEHLTKIYRYILQNLNRTTISIQEELQLLHSYLFLMEIRYKDSIQLNISSDIRTAEGHILPASLQLLVENAIKHNQFSCDCPLSISIYKEDDYVVVENILHPILSKLKSTRIGLKSIMDRYAILSDMPPVIKETSEKFIVKLPILQV